MRNSSQLWEEWAGLHKLHLAKLINLNIFKYINVYKKNNEKQARTNIGLADTLIPSSFIYLIYMGGIGPCDSIKIIIVYHVHS